ncbi:hypothetical protein Tfont_02208 [Tepidimonas fonticaldi]|uniref:Uncharacterized protein n=1 Tax=Tepidimonas fonticaldi TaxID=1101373 RepID=A0A554XIP8_9BURK|nr:hypothetical protein [Tepidimonas fonticaldi]MCX7662636.1 hypothetical protein [Tepidimonas fonticaldi]TSE35697.1 hypothetical protein Tfont_02208 [Tepidimonas fonticaldi]
MTMRRRDRMLLHPVRMLSMTLPFRAARTGGVGISPGVRPLMVWLGRMLAIRLADADIVRYRWVWLLRRR